MKQQYLLAFNVISCLLWAATTAITVQYLAAGKPVDKLYDHVHTVLFAAQSMALLEIFHSLFGLVRSSFVSALMQVSSRLLLTWGVTYLFPSSRQHAGFALMTLSWCAVEIPRYMFYAVNINSEVPHWLKWLRYSLFIILYPSGISGEVWCIWRGLDEVAKSGFLTYAMPNQLNFGFSYYGFLLFALVLYVPGSPFMFSHMWALRGKVLGPQPVAEVPSKTKPKAQ